MSGLCTVLIYVKNPRRLFLFSEGLGHSRIYNRGTAMR